MSIARGGIADIRIAGGMRLLALVLVGCGHRAPPVGPTGPPDLDAVAGPPQSCDGAASTWVDREIGRDHVRYAAGLDPDADRGTAALTAARDGLGAELGVPGDATVPVWLWLAPASPKIKAGTAMTRTYPDQVTLLVASPACDADPRPRQLERTVVLQLAPEYLRAAVDASPAGWKLAAAPSWFVQGGAAFLTGLVHEPPADRTAWFETVATESPEGAIVDDGGRVGVADPKRDGAALLGWLAATRGPDVLTRILASDTDTFDAALAEIVGPEAPAVAYGAWRAGR